MKLDELATCRANLARHSKSFAFAARFLPRESADRAASLYAWCRRADDAVDGVPRARQRAAIGRLRAELERVYAGEELADPRARAFQRVVAACSIPREYPHELLRGMEMDASGARYESFDELLVYCHRVAGVVGLMMAQVLGARRRGALIHAAHLGIAMQLTNVARDVREDWGLGRLYLPERWLAEAGAPRLRERLGEPFPEAARAATVRVVSRLLREAERFYRSGDRGLADLPWRAALGVRTARLVYAAIGARVEARGIEARAFVPLRSKLALALRAMLASLAELPGRAALQDRGSEAPARVFEPPLRFPEDVLSERSDRPHELSACSAPSLPPSFSPPASRSRAASARAPRPKPITSTITSPSPSPK